MITTTDPQLAALEAVADKHHGRGHAAYHWRGMSHRDAERRAACDVAEYLRAWVARWGVTSHGARGARCKAFGLALLAAYEMDTTTQGGNE